METASSEEKPPNMLCPFQAKKKVYVMQGDVYFLCFDIVYICHVEIAESSVQLVITAWMIVLCALLGPDVLFWLKVTVGGFATWDSVV